MTQFYDIALTAFTRSRKGTNCNCARSFYAFPKRHFVSADLPPHVPPMVQNEIEYSISIV